jgi:hypothetical protein
MLAPRTYGGSMIKIDLTEIELAYILDAINDFLQVIADELSDDWKYKDTPEYKFKSESLKRLKELQDKLLFKHDLLTSKDSQVSKGDWIFHRSSGFAGWRCTKCATWVYNNQPKVCNCDVGRQAGR